MSEPARSSRKSGERVGLGLFLFTFVALMAAGQQLFLIEFKRDDFGLVDSLAGTSGVAVSDDGRYVFVTAQGEHALTVFEREPFFGSLNFVEDHEDGTDGVFGLFGASGLDASPDGRHVYVTGAYDDTLVVFSRDATTDHLTFVPGEVKANNVGGVIGLDGAFGVVVSDDDEQVFVVAAEGDAIAVFSRDATSDGLSFVEAEINGFGGVAGLDGASAVDVSPDHRHVYVTGRVDDSLVLFTRQGDGTIEPSATYADGVGGVDGLDGACGVAVSPDGLHVYAVGEIDNALAAFSRNPATGELTFLGIERDGLNGVDGLAGAAAVAISPLGDRVFVAGRDDNAVALFRRKPSTGALDLLDVKKTTGPGLRGAFALAVTPDTFQVYVASRDDNAVAGLYLALCEGDEGTGDSDGDAICDDLDTCVGDDLVGDGDTDGVCDDFDLCPGFDDMTDGDNDGNPDGCDLCAGDDALGDGDGDLVCNDLDVCPGFDDNLDGDADSIPDGCDLCQGDDAAGDSDGDLVCNDLDACPGFDDNLDGDADSIPDGCDLCQGDDAAGDSDADLVCNDLDACLGFDDSLDGDNDGVPDGCDLCAGDDAAGDNDGDLICDDLDCAPGDVTVSALDVCGVCGGDNSSCTIFSNDFESGNLSAWSASVP